MRRFACALLFASTVIAAAWPGAATAGKPAAPAKPAKAKPGACPEQSALAGRLVKLWKLTNNATVVGVSCTEGKFPAAGWAVVAWIHTPGEGEKLEQRLALITTKGKELAFAVTPRPLSDLAEVRLGTPLVGDLDGDKVDEVFYPDRNSNQGFQVYALEVWRWADKQLTPLLRRTYASDNDGLVKKDQRVICDGSYELVADGKKMTLVITGTIKKGPKAPADAAADCTDGTVTLRWQDGKLQ